jgi:hypothetical protein
MGAGWGARSEAEGQVMSIYTRQQIAGFNSHRERHRRPYVPASRPTPPARRPLTPHNAAIRDFSIAMDAAEKPRAILKKRFGYNDRQIGTLTLMYRRRMKKRRG